MNKADIFNGRLDLKVSQEVLSLLDNETARLRITGQKFGNRRPKHAAIVMTAIKHFVSLPPEQRDFHYSIIFKELTENTGGEND